jgi:hypothetical protein
VTYFDILGCRSMSIAGELSSLVPNIRIGHLRSAREDDSKSEDRTAASVSLRKLWQVKSATLVGVLIVATSCSHAPAPGPVDGRPGAGPDYCSMADLARQFGIIPFDSCRP